VASKFKLTKRQFERTVRDKITCKTHLEWENDSFNYIFGFLTKFSIKWHKKSLKTHIQSGRKVVSKLKLTETQFERTIRNKITHKTNLEWENDSFKNIFGILIKFPTKWHKKYKKIKYSQREKKCQSLNWPKHRLKRQSGTKNGVFDWIGLFLGTLFD